MDDATRVLLRDSPQRIARIVELGSSFLQQRVIASPHPIPYRSWMKPKMAQIQDPPLSQRMRRGDLRVQSRGPVAFTMSSLLHYGLRAALGRRIARDTAHVLSEYDDPNRKEYWKPDASQDDFILGDDVRTKWILTNGEPHIGTDREAREFMLERLASRVHELLPEGRGRVVEFGCGTGRNLFFLKRRFPALELMGLELVPSTVESARRRSEAFGLQVRFEVADVTQPSAYEPCDVVFSIHALEQIPDEFPLAVDNMLAMSKRGTVFFEPVWELFPKTLLGWAARFRRYNAGYLDGLLAYLQSRSDICVKYAEAMSTVGNPLNHTAEIVVVPRV